MILVADGRQQASTSLLAVPCKQSRFPILIGGNPETDTPPFMPFFYPMSWMTSAFPEQRVFERASCPDRLLSADNDSVDVYHFNDGSGDVANELVKDQFCRDPSGRQTLDHQPDPRH